MSYFNLYRHNFVRVAVAVPEVRVADPEFNVAQTAELMRQAASKNAVVCVFPELGLSAYSCEDLFQQQALVEEVLTRLEELLEQTQDLGIVAAVGAPLELDGLLYNCAILLQKGRILGVIPKTHLPNYREFYELRQFSPGDTTPRKEIELCGQKTPFGPGLIFIAENQPLLRIFVEICEDLWAPVPPSSRAVLAGATTLLNLSASNATVGKDDYRRLLAGSQSGRCIAAYAYSAAGFGESTTDLAWDGHGLIYQNGSLLAEGQRFSYQPQVVVADVDLDLIRQDRKRITSFGQSLREQRDELSGFREISFEAEFPADRLLPLTRPPERFPYVPADPGRRDERCEEVISIQVQGLVKRLRAMDSSKVVIGVSGGLDSTQALIVCARAMDVMDRPRSNILAFTMPGFATSDRTLQQALDLMAAVGCTAEEIDIRPSATLMLESIGHPAAKGEAVYDVTFENVQAGERTSHLFRLANLYGAPVVGTSDLSELALGWSTYGVGDQMAHYHVNASVPKTLIRHLIRYAARTDLLGSGTGSILESVLGTVISPELIPGESGDGPAQDTEAVVGPYELQDFHLYYALRFGFLPSKISFLAWCAWHDPDVGSWPEGSDDGTGYQIGEIKQWLTVFVSRFFGTSQFKRSALPNGPKVGSGGSLSPRGDWRAPSDSEATAWLEDLKLIPTTGP
ncbi:MAG TPA: NAD(+) synthase [Dehalococcoidia bacterium]|nr:NAD(+) synthase [Dehalococcoidia bacterium]